MHIFVLCNNVTSLGKQYSWNFIVHLPKIVPIDALINNKTWNFNYTQGLELVLKGEMVE